MKKTILITSVGSLVGQNILDSLHNRRQNIRIIGTNSMVEAANNFRCDKSYLVAEATNTDSFISDLISIIQKEKPDLIIPGRDDDVVVLTQLSQKMPNLKDHFLVGSESFAKVMDDKVLSYQFAKKYSLPFASTVESGAADTMARTKDLVKNFGFPLIAKPSKGNGSKGIFVITNATQLERVCNEPNFSIQPFFRQNKKFNIKLETDLGLPLFWEIPENKLYAAQAIITRERKLEEVFSFFAKMVFGKCERMDPYFNPELTKVVHSFVDAAILEGWRGPFNIQLKYDYRSGFQVIEMNGRFSGGTSARYHLGYDEVGRIINNWIGENVVPDTFPKQHKKIVTKILTDYEIDLADVEKLENEKVWTRG